MRLNGLAADADNAIAMPVHPQFIVPSAIGLFLLSIALGFVFVRALSRAGRDKRRDARADLRWALRRLLDGAIDPRSIGEVATELDAETFWSAVESLPGGLSRERRRRITDAFSGSTHTRAERRALSDDSPWRRELAARRLGLIVEERSRRALRAALRRGPESVSLAAARALGRYRDAATLHWLLQHPETLTGRSLRTRAIVFRAFGRGAMPRLARALDAGIADPGTRWAVIETLGLGGYSGPVHAFERALADENAEVRVAAARAIGRLQLDGCSAALMAALRDDAWPVRAQAAWALGRTRSEIAVRPLASRVEDRAWWVRRHAAYALWELGEEGRRALREIAYGSQDRYAREMALEVLGGGFKEYRGATSHARARRLT